MEEIEEEGTNLPYILFPNNKYKNNEEKQKDHN